MKLSNGSELNIDWSKITTKEWRYACSPGTDLKVSDEIAGRLVGLTAEEVEALNPIDNAMLIKWIFDCYEKAVKGDPKN